MDEYDDEDIVRVVVYKDDKILNYSCPFYYTLSDEVAVKQYIVSHMKEGYNYFIIIYRREIVPEEEKARYFLSYKLSIKRILHNSEIDLSKLAYSISTDESPVYLKDSSKLNLHFNDNAKKRKNLFYKSIF